MSYDYTYAKRWRYERAHGVTRLIDPAPTKAHIAMLLAAGLTKRSIAEAAGVSAIAISHLTRHNQQLVNRATAARILAVTPEHGQTRAAADGFVPRVGVIRRIQALEAIGHTAATIAAAGGARERVIHNLLNQKDGPWVSAKNRQVVLTAYAALWDQPGASTRTRGRALKRGWAPPMAWDDDTIDDPAAVPDLGDAGARVNTGRASADLIEDIEFLLDDDPLLTAQQLADRLGYSTRDAIQQALRRADRRDLVDRLARNAHLAKEAAA